eukprot:9485242-Pyramimonas_sp.AAC.1
MASEEPLEAKPAEGDEQPAVHTEKGDLTGSSLFRSALQAVPLAREKGKARRVKARARRARIKSVLMIRSGATRAIGTDRTVTAMVMVVHGRPARPLIKCYGLLRKHFHSS